MISLYGTTNVGTKAPANDDASDQMKRRAFAATSPPQPSRRRLERFKTDSPAIVRFGGVSIFGKLVDLSRSGARVELPQPTSAKTGEWAVLSSDGALRNGYDARIVAAEGCTWRFGFESTLVQLGIFGSDPT